MNLGLRMAYRWETVRDKNGSPYTFPRKRGTIEARVLTTKGVYRWISLINDRRECLYVGESKNLYRRLYGYLHRNPSQATSYRVGRQMKRMVGRKEIRLQLLRVESGRLGGRPFTEANLDNVHLRRSIEGALVYQEKKRGGCKLNRD